MLYDFDLLGTWPTDCFQQQSFINTLEDELNELRSFVETNSSLVVVISQPNEPTQGQWESAWIAQTGQALPIPATAVLLWYDTSTSTFAGLYGTVTGFTTVSKRISNFVKGMIAINETEYDATARSSLLSLYENNAVLPIITFTTYVPCTIIFDFEFNITAGTSNAGADFMLDNVKLGTQYNLITPNGGLAENFSAGGRQSISYVLEHVPAGVHVARPLLGVVGSPAAPSAVGWGGTSGVTIFSVKAVVE